MINGARKLFELVNAEKEALQGSWLGTWRTKQALRLGTIIDLTLFYEPYQFSSVGVLISGYSAWETEGNMIQ